MKITNIGNVNTTAIIVFILGCFGLVAVMLLDKLHWGNGIFTEGWPDLSPGHIVRSLMIFISVLAIFSSLIGKNRPKLRLDENSEFPFEKFSILSVLSISVVFLFLFTFNPSIFNVLSLEDGIIEWGSFVLLFGSSIVVAIAFFLSRKVLIIPQAAKVFIALLSLLFFVMAMEEVSWFQRILEIETPEMFGANIQRETNLHNFYTNPVENLYYNGTFLFLVIFPFIRFLFPCLLNNNYLIIFVARPFVGIIGSIACAYNFDMWNIIFTQIAFFSSLLVLFVFFVFSSNRSEKNIILLTLILVAVTQTVFLSNGVNFARLWEVTEYKEFFIPLALFIYSMDLFAHMKQAASPEKS